MTITIGWWVLPLLVTIAGIVIVLKPEPGGYIQDRFFTVPACLIVSLAAWLVWALLR